MQGVCRKTIIFSENKLLKNNVRNNRKRMIEKWIAREIPETLVLSYFGISLHSSSSLKTQE